MKFNDEEIKRLVTVYVAETETEEKIKNRRISIRDFLLGKVDNTVLTESEIKQGIKEREDTLIKLIESPMFIVAVKLCVENDFCSTSLLQKTFKISYNKAIVIIDSMEALNLISAIEKDFLPKRRILSSAKEFLFEKEEIIRKAWDKLIKEIVTNDALNLRTGNDSLVLILRKINCIKSVLNPRQMEVLELLYGLKDGKCYSIEEIGEKLNVTRERIKQIKAKALKKLRVYNSEQGLI